MGEDKKIDLYVEELEEEQDYSVLMANCVASGTSYACFSCPTLSFSSTTSLSTATS